MNTGLRLVSSLSRSACARPCVRPRIKRNYHQLEKLPYPTENGLGDFLPPEALKVVAIDYQAGLLQQLNEELRGMLLFPKSPRAQPHGQSDSKRGANSIRYPDRARRVSISRKNPYLQLCKLSDKQ